MDSVAPGAYNNFAQLEINAATKNLTLNTNFTGTGQLIKTGPNTLTISVTGGGANDGTDPTRPKIVYTGGTIIETGRLILAENNNDNVTRFSGTSNFTINNNAVLEVNSRTNHTKVTWFDGGGTISGTGSLVKSGVGVAIFRGNINGGVTIALTGGNSLIDVQGGVLRNDFSNSLWAGNKAGLNISGSGAFTPTFDLWDGDVFVDEVTGGRLDQQRLERQSDTDHRREQRKRHVHRNDL